MSYHIPLEPESYYHIFSRAIGNEKLFKEDKNYLYFLGKYKKYIRPIADTYCYCLLPNHFHFLIRIKPEQELNSVRPIQSFSNLFNSYTKAINKTYNRKGSLFIDYLRHGEVKDNAQLCATAFYIHKNPVHHGLCEKLEDWKWSSFNAVSSLQPSTLKREDVLQCFNGEDEFRTYHKQQVFLKGAYSELEDI